MLDNHRTERDLVPAHVRICLLGDRLGQWERSCSHACLERLCVYPCSPSFLVDDLVNELYAAIERSPLSLMIIHPSFWDAKA